MQKKNSNNRICNIEEYEFDPKTAIISRGSSKGYTKKFSVDGFWYKISAGAFNAHAETVASRLLKYTSIKSYVDYSLCKVNGEYATRAKDYINGCKHETIKSAYFKTYLSPIEDLENTTQGAELYNFIVNFVEKRFKNDFTKIFSEMFRFDALVMNEDRHFRNIEFIEDNGNWKPVPLFDFDCSLYACLEDLDDVKNYIKKSLPFFNTHEEQLLFLNTLDNQRIILSEFNPQAVTSNLWSDNYNIGYAEVTSYLNTLKGGIVL